jgi:hypothetical protein
MDSEPEIKKIEISQETVKNLNTLRKWTMFLSVLGFIFFGLIITLGLLTGTFLTAFSNSDKTTGIPDAILVAAFAGFAMINFFPILFLFRFSKHISNAVSTLNSREMHIAIKYLKRFFVYIGIILIAVIALYVASIILEGTSIAFLRGI